jgi:hypothetical protein
MKERTGEVVTLEKRTEALDAFMGMLSARGVCCSTMHFITSPVYISLLRLAAGDSWSSTGRALSGDDNHLAGRNRLVSRIDRLTSEKREELKKACMGATFCILSDASSARRMYFTCVMAAGVPGYYSPQLRSCFVSAKHYNSESKALQMLVSMVAYDIHCD